MDIQSFYSPQKRIRFQVKRLKACKWPWFWKATKASSGRMYRTIALARAAGESYLDRFGDISIRADM